MIGILFKQLFENLYQPASTLGCISFASSSITGKKCFLQIVFLFLKFMHANLGGGNSNMFLLFTSRKLGEDVIHFLTNIFFNWVG